MHKKDFVTQANQNWDVTPSAHFSMMGATSLVELVGKMRTPKNRYYDIHTRIKAIFSDGSSRAVFFSIFKILVSQWRGRLSDIDFFCCFHLDKQQ